MSTSRSGSDDAGESLGPGGHRPGAFPGLAALLWTVRGHLEFVLYRLVVIRLVVTDGSPRWLPRADAELQDTLAALRSAEVLRAAEFDGVTPTVRTPSRGSLESLIKVVPEPWPSVFADHRDALWLLIAEIDAATIENTRLLRAASRGSRTPVELSSPAKRDDAVVTAAYRTALATLETVPQLSLHDFLA